MKDFMCIERGYEKEIKRRDDQTPREPGRLGLRLSLRSLKGSALISQVTEMQTGP